MDQCLFYRRSKKFLILVAVYVGDLIVSSTSLKVLNEFGNKLATFFNITTPGKLNHCLGLHFQLSDNRDWITVDQAFKIEEMVRRFQTGGGDRKSVV